MFRIIAKHQWNRHSLNVAIRDEQNIFHFDLPLSLAKAEPYCNVASCSYSCSIKLITQNNFI